LLTGRITACLVAHDQTNFVGSIFRVGMTRILFGAAIAVAKGPLPLGGRTGGLIREYGVA